MAADEADVAKENLLTKLQGLESTELGEICVGLSLTVPPNKKGKRSAMFNIIVKYLSSDTIEESEDGGLQLFRDVLKQVGEMKKDIKSEEKVLDKKDGDKDKTEIKQSGSKTNDDSKMNPNPRVTERSHMFKLKEFKVNGGLTGDSGNISEFIKICSQMQKGKILGYTEEEIRIGIIDSLKPDSALRKYFDGKVEVTQDKFMKMLKSWYQVKESLTFLTKMQGSAQEPKESEAQFLLRMIGLRDTIITLNADEEECSFGGKLVRRQFLHALTVGFTTDTIRLELRQALKEPDMEDDEMTREVLEAVARDLENRRKTKGKVASSNRLGAEERNDRDGEGNSSDNALLTKISKEFSTVTAAVNKLAAWQEQVQKRLDKEDTQRERARGANAGGGNENQRRGPGGGYRFIKCEDCEENRLFCTHCSICGQGDHKRNVCPTKTRSC